MNSPQLAVNPSLPRRLWELLKLLALAFDSRKDAAPRIYEILSTHNNLAEKSLYLNMGYWKQATTYDAACEALAAKLGQYAALSSGDVVLDVGCGFGDQDRYFLHQFGPRKIIGLNITGSQLEIAARRNPDPRLEWVFGSATKIPFADESFDKVIALESGFHFVTRAKFFAEAHRVMRPGAVLALADVVVSGEERNLLQRMTDAIGHRLWQVPDANLYTLDVYCEKLRALGFVDVEAEDISAEVYKPFEAFARRRVQDPDVRRRLNPLLRMAWTAPNDAMSGTRYVLVRARKAS